MVSPKSYWLVKSEPESFSIDDLARAPGQTSGWDGVRNYQARNFMRDGMKLGDRVLFYHSSSDPPSVAGTAVVAREAYPDHTAWDKGNDHFDPKASRENPIWQMVDLKFESKFERPIPLARLREVPALAKMELLRPGSRLSVQPVRPAEFAEVLKLATAVTREDDAPAVKKKTSSSTKKKPSKSRKKAQTKAKPKAKRSSRASRR